MNTHTPANYMHDGQWQHATCINTLVYVVQHAAYLC